MSSTYSTNLALELIGTGDQAGTWGSTTNTNLGTLIEQAVSGYVTQAITDGADTVITIPNGASGVARNMFIECTGALTAARNLLVPTNKKLYFIYNNTSGGYAVTVKVSGQTGVSVPSGAKILLVSNGTDIVLATNYMLSPTLASATLTSPTLSSAVLGTPSSGTLTNCTGLPLTTGVSGILGVSNGGTGVTTSTGSGSNVLSTSPTLVTPLLGTPTSGTLTNCTGLPISTGVSGLGANVATFLATPSSANLASAVSDETGSGSLVFATSPTLTSPTLVTAVLGTPTSGTLTNCTGLPVSSGISGLGTNVATFLATPSSANLAAAVTDETGTGALVFASSPSLTSPNLTTPVLGTPSSGTLSNCTADGTNPVGFRNIPQNSQTSAYVLVASDVGKHVSITTGGVTCNASVFSAGDVVSIYNNSGSTQTITAGTNVTFRLAGTNTTGNRSLLQYGIATLLCIVGGSTPTFVVSGNVT